VYTYMKVVGRREGRRMCAEKVVRHPAAARRPPAANCSLIG
jgi:hypothetical protein